MIAITTHRDRHHGLQVLERVQSSQGCATGRRRMKSAHKVAVMENDEFVRCPLSDGLAKVRRADLIALLAEANLREKLKRNMAEFASFAAGDQAGRRLRNSPRWQKMFATAG